MAQYPVRGLKRWCRALTWGRTVVLLSAMLAAIQLLYLVLLGKQSRHAAEYQTSQHQHDQITRLTSSVNEAVKSSYVIDTSGQYRIVHFLHKSDWDRRATVNDSEHIVASDVTIVTQCSANHLLHLISLREAWLGPISVAVFAPQTEAHAVLEAVVAVLHCFPDVRETVSIHLVTPLTSKGIPMTQSPKNISCDTLRRIGFYRSNMDKTTTLNYAVASKYPNNLLRNVARHAARTVYVFVIDIDMLPNVGLHKNYTHFLKQTTLERALENKTVHVIPSFEINTDTAIPKQKHELLEMWRKELLRPFYYELCWKCQRYTAYDRWQNLKRESELRISYEIEWHDPWEPFYIAPRTVPVFDERFKQYGFNRVSQVFGHINSYTL